MKKKYLYIIVVLLTVATLAAFIRIGGNDFINFDDEGYITENNHIKSGINPESIKWAFQNVVMSNWVPLAMLSHMVDWSLFGRDASGHHIVSLLLHIGAVIFLFLFLNKTTNNIWSAAFAAAFFALHPLRVESVAWASERKDVLSMFFGMAALWAYAFYAEKPKLSNYFTCLILFALSLLSKSMLITLPFVLLLLDYWPLKRWQQEITGPNKNIILNRLILEKIPFFLLAIIFSIITFLVQYEANTVYPSLTVRIINAIVAYGAYLGKTFWPVDLTLVYFFVYSFPAWQIIVSFLLLTLITLGVIYHIKSKPYLFVGWFWYLGTLVPVIGLVPTSALLADHYTYLPSIGIAVMLSWGIPSLIKREEARRKILFSAAILVLAVLIVLTWQQCGYWKNGVDLWNHALNVTKNNVLTRNNPGFAIFTEKNIEEAVPQKKAISIRQDSFLYYNRGNAYAEKGQYQPAIDDYNKAIRLQPNFTSAYFNRGNVYKNLGQYKMAIKSYNHTILISPDFIVAYNLRGLAYGKLGEYESALENFNEAISLKPDYASAYNNRGFTYLLQDKIIFGCSDSQKACALGKCQALEWGKSRGLCR